jgi:23S rRNA (uracil1939-C5)-methyltransferase
MYKTITTRIDKAVFGGLTVSRPETQPEFQKVVLAQGAIPGEIAELSITAEKKSYLHGTVNRIIEPSPERVRPICRYFGVCGGCHYQFASYRKQIEMKQSALCDCMRRIAGMDVDVVGTNKGTGYLDVDVDADKGKDRRGNNDKSKNTVTNMVLDQPLIDITNIWNYRHRGRFRVVDGRIGFNREKSNRIVEIDHCPIVTESINEALSKIRSVLKRHRSMLGSNLPVSIDEILIAHGVNTAVNTNCDVSEISSAEESPARNDNVIAYVITTKKVKLVHGDQLDRLAAVLAGCGLNGVCIASADGDAIRYYGDCNITLPLGNLDYAVSPMSFFQANWKLNSAMVDVVLRQLGPLQKKRILDLYSGAGNFALPLACKAGHVTAIEENPHAVRSGLLNAERNRIDNLDFLNIRVENIEERHFDGIDAVIIDPPRSGMAKTIVPLLLRRRPETIIYISCDPPTLARDIKLLSVSYEIESLRLADMFPQTYHMECIASLQKKS